MPPLYTSIDSLVASKTTQAVKVRCVRVYNKYATGVKTEIARIECVVHDAEGTRIQITVSNKLLNMFAKKLNEGGVYQIMNFMVKRNIGKYKITNHAFRLELTMKTMISEVFQQTFPKYMFSFKSFEEILSIESIDAECQFDVIGVITGKGFVKNDTDGKMVELKLEDEKHNHIYCTLWEDYVDMFLKQVDKNDKRAKIIIIQFCRPNFYRGEMRACTSYNASRIYLNTDIQEIEDFRKRIAGNESFVTKLDLCFEKTIVEKDDFFNGTIIVKTIDDIFCCEEGEHWICAKIDSVDCYTQWCYNACKRCTRKVVKSKGRFYCGSCDKYDGTVNKRYQLILNVIDSTNNASLLVWDKEAVALVGKKAVEINMDDKEAADVRIVPKEVDQPLTERVVMFKIQMRTESAFVDDKPYTVTKTCTDETVVNHFWKGHDVAGVSGPLDDLFEKSFLEQCESLSQISDLSMARGIEMDYEHVLSTPKKVPESAASSKIGQEYKTGGSVKRCLVDEFSNVEEDCKKLKTVQVKKEKDQGS